MDRIYDYKVNAELAIESLMSEVFYNGEILNKEDAERVREIYKSLTDCIEQNDYILFTELEYIKEQTNEK
jgi:hypothetical protein